VLHVCHTNADSPVGGVSEAMATALGLVDVRPLEPAAKDPVDKLVVFVPHDAVAAVRDAVTAAGAGALGDYDHCTFVSTGTGTFRPLVGAHPAVGAVGRVEQVPETRLETVLPRHRRPAVLAALRSAHPYEEPAFDLLEMAELPGGGGSGRLGRLPAPEPLAAFTRRVVAALPATPSVARVAGDPDRTVQTVALCGGAGDFLLDRVRGSGADVYVTSDLRHHPVSEFREHAWVDEEVPALVDVPHMAAEWTWLPPLAGRLAAALGGVVGGAAGGTAGGVLGGAVGGAVGGGDTTVEVRVSTTVTDPWTASLPMTGSGGLRTVHP